MLTAPQSELESLLEQGRHFYRTFRPRPDQHERFDQQESFVNSETKGVAFLIGGNSAGTTEAAMHKVAKFVLSKQPPPRKDTPFWIIAGSYEQVCEACWKEKLEGHGHIPPVEIDYDRIAWYKPNDNWPFRVPLKPWPGRPGKNWVLEFKSYKQGREQLQARAIGGFCFVEQFPWGLLTEVVTRCREYAFPGSQFCEFTPIDPLLSYPLERMMQDGELPAGWEVWRANTECAVEAGHAQRDWYNSWLSMLPDSEKLTRQIGAWATYVGAIYQKFSERHCVSDDVIFPGKSFPSNVFHRRGIDWGSGPENAFCCLWAYRNGKGQWFIYDEYYSTEPISTIGHLSEVQDRSNEWGWNKSSPHFGATYADPSSAGDFQLAAMMKQYAPDYENMHLSKARNAVLPGIAYVEWCLQHAPELNGEPRLFISKERCKNLIRQMRSYRWDEGTDNRDPRREPKKKDDHAVDPLRYILFSEAHIEGVHPSVVDRGWNPKRHGVHGVGGNRNGHTLAGR